MKQITAEELLAVEKQELRELCLDLAIKSATFHDVLAGDIVKRAQRYEQYLEGGE